MKITLVAEQLARQLEVEEEIGMEGFDSFLDFVTSTIAEVRGLFKKAINEDFRGIEVMPRDFAQLEKLLQVEGKSFKDIAEVVIYRPEKMSGAMADFTKELLNQYGPLTQIGDTLYQPLIKWFAQAIANPDFMEKVWNDRMLEVNDVEEMQDEFAKYFKRTRDEHGTDMSLCSELYGSIKQMEKTYGHLLQAANLGKDLDLKALKTQEERLSLYVKELIDAEVEADKHDSVNSIPRATKQKLAEALRHIATETEYLVTVNYMLIVAITAWNDSFNKIELAIQDSKED